MSIVDSLRVAYDSLTAHLLRTLLAMLGLVIGVGAVITLLAVGRGSQDDVQRNIQSLGTNLLTVRAGAPSSGGVRQAAGSRPTLTYEDAQAIIAPGAVEHVAALTVEQNVPVQLVVPGGSNFATQAIGTDDLYPIIRSTPLSSGEFFSDEHVRSSATVVVLGANVATQLFGAESPVGQTVRLSLGRAGTSFTILGVLSSRGGTALGNLDDRVLVARLVIAVPRPGLALVGPPPNPRAEARGLRARPGGGGRFRHLDLGAPQEGQALRRVRGARRGVLRQDHLVAETAAGTANPEGRQKRENASAPADPAVKFP